MSRSIIFLVKLFLGNLYRHLAYFSWSHCPWVIVDCMLLDFKLRLSKSAPGVKWEQMKGERERLRDKERCLHSFRQFFYFISTSLIRQTIRISSMLIKIKIKNWSFSDELFSHKILRKRHDRPNRCVHIRQRTIMWNGGRGGGPVVSILAFNSQLRRSEFESCWRLQYFSLNFVIEKNEKKQKEAGVGPF